MNSYPLSRNLLLSAALTLGLMASSAAAPALAAGVALREFAADLHAPSALVPYDNNHFLILDQVGVAYVFTADGKRLPTPFIDVRSRLAKLNEGFDERGLLGLALHPGFSENRRLFVYYSAPLQDSSLAGWDHTSRIAEFKVFEDKPFQVDPASERVLLEFHQPYFNHNSGSLLFGADGHLYISTGDGGNANDKGRGHSPQGNGQDTSNFLGKVLRIDVDGAEPYGIPNDNPFARGGGRPEIYAYGLRNPWGFSFDRGGSGELFLADVGQNAFEEVNIITRGGNYGWNILEGSHCFDPDNPNTHPADCPKVGADGKPLIDPILEYKNAKAFPRDPEAKGTCVVGGYVYRGKAFPRLEGKYVFADWSRNWVLPDGVLFVGSRPSSDDGKWSMEPLPLASHPDGKIGVYVWALGEDARGELYVLANTRNSVAAKTGKVFKLVPQ